jgi:hypothetical protein
VLCPSIGGEPPSGKQADPAKFVVMHQLVQAGHGKMKPIAWNYLLGCSDTETTMRRNCQALDSIAFKPRAARRRQGRYAR